MESIYDNRVDDVRSDSDVRVRSHTEQEIRGEVEMQSLEYML